MDTGAGAQLNNSLYIFFCVINEGQQGAEPYNSGDACLLTGFFLTPAAQSEEYFDPDAEPQEQTAIPAESEKQPEEKQVLIFLKEDLPENRPYTMDGTKYQRDIAVPVLSGAKGFIGFIGWIVGSATVVSVIGSSST